MDIICTTCYNVIWLWTLPSHTVLMFPYDCQQKQWLRSRKSSACDGGTSVLYEVEVEFSNVI